LRRRSEQGPRLANIAVALPQMHAVRAEALGESHAVVDDEGDIGVGADPLQRLGKPGQLVIAYVLHAQLEGGCDPRLERRPQSVVEWSADVLRADQIELGRFFPLRRREVDRIKFGFVQGQAATRATEAS